MDWVKWSLGSSLLPPTVMMMALLAGKVRSGNATLGYSLRSRNSSLEVARRAWSQWLNLPEAKTSAALTYASVLVKVTAGGPQELGNGECTHWQCPQGLCQTSLRWGVAGHSSTRAPFLPPSDLPPVWSLEGGWGPRESWLSFHPSIFLQILISLKELIHLVLLLRGEESDGERGQTGCVQRDVIKETHCLLKMRKVPGTSLVLDTGLERQESFPDTRETRVQAVFPHLILFAMPLMLRAGMGRTPVQT